MAIAAGDPPGTWGELATFLRDVGFPMAVATYVLVRIEPAIRDLTTVVSEMKGLLEQQWRDRR